MMDKGKAVMVDPELINNMAMVGDQELVNNIDWPEFVSVIIQTLHALCYGNTAQWLEYDIAFSNHQPLKFANLRTQFLGGFWEKCAEILCSIGGLTQEAVTGAMLIIFSMWLDDRLAVDQNFPISKILENQFASLFSHDKLAGMVLTNPGRLNNLRLALKRRKTMLKRLQLCLPCLVPTFDKKLLALINCGIDAEIYSCVFHNKKVIPLYCDRSCGKHHLPTKTMQILNGLNKVLCLKFSHNGLYLASGSVAGIAIIWEVGTGWGLRQKYFLPGHLRDITCVSWSFNDESLLTCSLECINMWDVLTGVCTGVMRVGGQLLKSCAFLNSDPIGIVYGTSMLNGSIRLLKNGYNSEIVSFPTPEGCSTVDLAVTPDGTKVIYYDSVDGEGKFTIMNIITGVYCSFMEGVTICGISVSEDNEILIINLINHEIHVWDLNRLDERPLTYWNFKQINDGSFTSVGGAESRFLVSGTADSKVCIWNRRQARPIAVLSGHTSAVGCVSWNPQRPQILASASDDGTIRIWGPQSQEVPQLF